MSTKRSQSLSPETDLEKGISPKPADPLSTGDPKTTSIPEQPPGDTSDDSGSDTHDKFWELFVEEAASEAKWRVESWATQLDAVLVFTGLFAGVVSAFLIDIRSNLHQDPQLAALTEIISVLRNNTAPISAPGFQPSNSALWASGLYFISLGVTLISALGGVLAKGWLGEIQRSKTSGNPADKAIDRWGRDQSVVRWHLVSAITMVPLLIQLGLALFLAGFVIQTFGDNVTIGSFLTVLVAVGSLLYTIITFLPLVWPHCPFQTPLTTLLHLIPPTSTPKSDSNAEATPKIITMLSKLAAPLRASSAIASSKSNIDKKISIVLSKLTRSSDDKIFCAAASVLNEKLESDKAEQWYDGVKKEVSSVAQALLVRLSSFSRQFETMSKKTSVLIPQDTSPGINGAGLVGTIYSPAEQGVTCLRVVLQLIQAEVITDGSEKLWDWIYKQETVRRWRSSNTLPETWRFLTFSIHTAVLVHQKKDCDEDDVVKTDWETVIRQTSSDQYLRSISHATACRGLLEGQKNLRRACALSLAMFIEIGGAPLLPSTTEVPAMSANHTKILWDEFVKMWKNAVNRLLEDDESFHGNNFVRLYNHELYSDEIQGNISRAVGRLVDLDSDGREVVFKTLPNFKGDGKTLVSPIAMVIGQLDNINWYTRQQALQMLTKLSEHVVLQEIMKAEKAIPKIIDKLMDNDYDVRNAAVEALLAFSAYDLYQDEVKSSIPSLLKQLDEGSIRPALEMLSKLSKHTVFQETINVEEAIPKIAAKVKNDDTEICSAAIEALSAFGAEVFFQETVKNTEVIPEIGAKLADSDSNVRLSAMKASSTFAEVGTYQSEVKASVPAILKQLDHDYWRVRQQAGELVAQLSEYETFRETMKTEGAVSKTVDKLSDSDSDVRAAAFKVMSVFINRDFYHGEVKLAIPTLIKGFNDGSWYARQQAIQMVTKLSEYDIFQETMMEEGAIREVTAKLADDDVDVRAAAVEAIIAFSSHEVYRSDVKSSIPAVIKQMNGDSWRTRQQAIQMLTKLSENDTFQETLHTEEAVLEALLKLADGDSDVREAATQAISAFNSRAYYQDEVKSSISTIIKRLDNETWPARQQAIQTLTWLSENSMFQEAMKEHGAVPRIITKLADPDPDIFAAVIKALVTFGTQELFHEEVIPSIPAMLKQIHAENWSTRQQVVQILGTLSKYSIFHEKLKAEEAVPKLIAKLKDDNEEVRSAVVQALAAFSAQVLFQDAIKNARVISEITAKLVDNDSGILIAAIQAISTFGAHELYQGEVKSSIPTLVKYLDNESWYTRQQIILSLTNLSKYGFYQETMKTEKVVSKLTAKLTDRDDDVRVAAVEAISAFGTNGTFQDTVKAEKAVHKLVAKLADSSSKVSDAAIKALSTYGREGWSEDQMKGFVIPSFMQELQSIPARLPLYPVLDTLSQNDMFFSEISGAINELLDKMKNNDHISIRRSIAILTEITGDDVTWTTLRNNVLDALGPASKLTQQAVQNAVQSRLIYNKDSLSRGEVVEILLRLSENKLLRAGMKSAISGLIEAVSDNDWSIRSTAVAAISALASEAEFKTRLKFVVPVLIKRLGDSQQISDDRRDAAFPEAACNLISQLCLDKTIGTDLVPQLTRVLSEMDVSVADHLLKLLRTLLDNSVLTMNDRIALASSLRVVSPAQPAFEVQICRLEMAAALHKAHQAALELERTNTSDQPESS